MAESSVALEVDRRQGGVNERGVNARPTKAFAWDGCQTQQPVKINTRGRSIKPFMVTGRAKILPKWYGTVRSSLSLMGKWLRKERYQTVAIYDVIFVNTNWLGNKEECSLCLPYHCTCGMWSHYHTNIPFLLLLHYALH